jgi:anti-anti-sigma factor
MRSRREPRATRVEISAATTEDTVAVTITGDLDAVTVPVLRRHLAWALEQRPRTLVLDLAEVPFLDCAAANAIMEAGRALPAHRCLVLRRPCAIARRLLALTGLDAECAIQS